MNEKTLTVESGLLPCPFCGGEAEKVDLTDEDNFGGSVICCKSCGASSPVHFDRKENLEDSWNRRAPDPAAAKVRSTLEELEDALTKRVEWHQCFCPEPCDDYGVFPGGCIASYRDDYRVILNRLLRAKEQS